MNEKYLGSGICVENVKGSLWLSTEDTTIELSKEQIQKLLKYIEDTKFLD